MAGVLSVALNEVSSVMLREEDEQNLTKSHEMVSKVIKKDLKKELDKLNNN